MEQTGRIFLINETQVISDKFKKREFILEIENETNSDWNDFVKFELIQDKVSVLDGLSINDKVNVNFNLKGRKWEKDGKINFRKVTCCYVLRHKVKKNSVLRLYNYTFTDDNELTSISLVKKAQYVLIQR